MHQKRSVEHLVTCSYCPDVVWDNVTFKFQRRHDMSDARHTSHRSPYSHANKSVLCNINTVHKDVWRKRALHFETFQNYSFGYINV